MTAPDYIELPPKMWDALERIAMRTGVSVEAMVEHAINSLPQIEEVQEFQQGG